MNNTGRNTTIRDRNRRTIARSRPECHICKGEHGPIDYQAGHLDPLAFTVDHIVPWSISRDDSLENLAAAHRMCNRTKSDRVDELTDGPVYVTTRTW